MQTVYFDLIFHIINCSAKFLGVLSFIPKLSMSRRVLFSYVWCGWDSLCTARRHRLWLNLSFKVKRFPIISFKTITSCPIIVPIKFHGIFRSQPNSYAYCFCNKTRQGRKQSQFMVRSQTFFNAFCLCIKMRLCTNNLTISSASIVSLN